jgi:hypothetical protein
MLVIRWFHELFLSSFHHLGLRSTSASVLSYLCTRYLLCVTTVYSLSDAPYSYHVWILWNLKWNYMEITCFSNMPHAESLVENRHTQTRFKMLNMFVFSRSSVNYLEHSPSWEADGHPDSKEIHLLLRNRRWLCSQGNLILSEINRIYIFTLFYLQDSF